MIRPASAFLVCSTFLSSAAFAQGSMLDLSITNLTSPTGTVLYYDPIPVSFTIQSSDAQFTGNVGFEISVVGPAGVPSVIHTGSAFVSGGSAAVSEMPSLPSTISAGAILTVLVRIDPTNVIAESDEANNLGMSPGSFTVLGSELVATALTAPARATRGTAILVDLTITNSSNVEARDFIYQLALTPSSGPGMVIFTSMSMTIPGQSSVVLSDSVSISAIAPLGGGNITLFVDATGVVPESTETNNIRRTPIVIVDPAPDFTIALADVPTMVEAGQQVDISRMVSNLGDLPGTVDFELYLSTDATITTGDLSLGGGSTMVGAGGANSARMPITIPGTVNAGTYYIGAIVDPLNAIPEHDETNNTFSSGMVAVFAGPLTIITSSLPSGIVGVVYRADLVASGTSGAEVWSITAGGLPSGLALVGNEIIGRPTTAGVYTFVVEVADGASTDSAAMQIEIREAPEPIAILTPSLPSAILGRPYEVFIVVTGGAPPLRWDVQGLPLGLSSNGETISGVPEIPGTFDVTVTVSDAASSATERYTLTVLPGTSDLLLVDSQLPDGVVGLDYCAGGVVELGATGGAPPYEFEMIDGEVPGLVLESDGSICGIPRQVGQHSFVVRVSDSALQIDTGRLMIEVTATGLRVATDSLPDAVVGSKYDATIEASGGDGALSWSLASGALPPGISLAGDGTITGTAEMLGTFTFAVAVRDTVGAEHVAPLAIRVVKGSGLIETGAEGCSCRTEGGRGGFGALLLLFGFGLWTRQRLRGRGTP